MLEKDSRGGGASHDVFGATSNAISDSGGNGSWSPTGKSNDDDSPRVQHAVSEARPSARSSQHGSFPPAADSVIVQTPRLMPVNSTSNSQPARTRRRPDMVSLWRANGRQASSDAATHRVSGTGRVVPKSGLLPVRLIENSLTSEQSGTARPLVLGAEHVHRDLRRIGIGRNLVIEEIL